MTSIQRGDFTGAEALLRGLYKRHPRNFEVNESLGLACAGQGQLKEALSFFRSAVQEEPNQAIPHANLGTTYLKLGEASDATRELSLAARLDPVNPRTEEAFGEALMLVHEPRRAQAAFTLALEKDSENPDLLYDSALAAYENGEWSRAETLLAQMPGLASSASGQALFGDVAEKQGDYEKAAKYYAAAAALEPDEGNVYELGLDFLRHWSFEPAQRELEAGVKRFPESTRMRFVLGVAYYGGQEYGQAIAMFANLLESDPDNEQYAQMLGLGCAHLTEGAEPQCSEVIKFARQHPADETLAVYAATSILHQHSNAGQINEAQLLLRRAIQKNPGLPDAHFEMGYLLQVREQWAQSISELQKTIRIKPDYPHAHYRLALAYSHTGQKERARTEVILEQRYSAQASAVLDRRMNQITMLLVTMK